MSKFDYAISTQELKERQLLPLNIKVAMTRMRIREFIREYGEDNVYVSFSGGKDSLVLLHLVRQDFPKVMAVFLDTWMEYPQIRSFVKTFDNVTVIKPEKSMKQIVDDCGWCFPSKDMAEAIEAYRRGADWARKKLMGLDGNGSYSEFRQRYKKWLKVAEDAPFKIGPGCCLEQKEKPVIRFEKETGKKPMVALLADESARRKEAYLRTGCNSFGKRPISKPMGFWTEQDVLNYIKNNGLQLAEPYGKIERVGQSVGQLSILDMSEFAGSEYDACCGNCKLYTTKEKRTGCMFCPVGGHIRDRRTGEMFSKIKRVKSFNQNLYDYIMDGLGMSDVIKWVESYI